MKDIVVKWFKNNNNELYELMKNTSHHHSNGNKNPFHMEGSIWTHTEMVLELTSNDINQIFAALLHDIGKVYTRKEKESGKVSFFYHENVSMYKSIDILKEAKKEFNNIDILKILKLINWHGTLWKKKMDSTSFHKELNLKYGNDIDFYKSIISFVEADAFGRILENEDEEYKVLEKFEFLNNYVPFDINKYNNKRDSEVVFMIGLSGSGKSTLLKTEYKNYKILSVDSYFEKKKMNYDMIDYDKNIKKAFDQFLKQMNESIQKKENVVIDMTNLSIETRRKKLSKFPSTQYNKKAIVFLNGEKEIYNNLNKREGKKLSKKVIESQIITFELPNFDEFDEIEYII